MGACVATTPYVLTVVLLRAGEVPRDVSWVPACWLALAVLLAPLAVGGLVADGRRRARSRA